MMRIAKSLMPQASHFCILHSEFCCDWLLLLWNGLTPLFEPEQEAVDRKG